MNAWYWPPEHWGCPLWNAMVSLFKKLIGSKKVKCKMVAHLTLLFFFFDTIWTFLMLVGMNWTRLTPRRLVRLNILHFCWWFYYDSWSPFQRPCFMPKCLTSGSLPKRCTILYMQKITICLHTVNHFWKLPCPVDEGKVKELFPHKRHYFQWRNV